MSTQALLLARYSVLRSNESSSHETRDLSYQAREAGLERLRVRLRRSEH